jgi:hypothetical protein
MSYTHIYPIYTICVIYHIYPICVIYPYIPHIPHILYMYHIPHISHMCHIPHIYPIYPIYTICIIYPICPICIIYRPYTLYISHTWRKHAVNAHVGLRVSARHAPQTAGIFGHRQRSQSGYPMIFSFTKFAT